MIDGLHARHLEQGLALRLIPLSLGETGGCGSGFERPAKGRETFPWEARTRLRASPQEVERPGRGGTCCRPRNRVMAGRQSPPVFFSHFACNVWAIALEPFGV